MTLQQSHVRQFLEALYSRYFREHDGYIEIRVIGKENGIAGSIFLRPWDLSDELLTDIHDLNQNCHIYFGVNPRPLTQGIKEADITDVVCLWADIDGKDFDNGKEEAHRRVEEFPLAPNIVVDSGHGFHCYWILEEPIIGIGQEERLVIKQTLSGIVNKLEADKHPRFLGALLRLPGTINIKEEGGIECKVVRLETEKKYRLDDFNEFRNTEYREPRSEQEIPLDFGSKRRIISIKDSQAAIADVQRLEIDSKIKRRIITGSKLTGKKNDKTRSGRDMSIICSLIYNDYDYATIRSVFFNSFLGCSNRIRAAGEAALQWDVGRALEYVQKVELTPEAQKILEIKKSLFIPKVEKPIAINNFIVKDLISGRNPFGCGYRKRSANIYYYFDTEEKRLMDLDSTDFYLFLRLRYGILRWDFEEIKDAVKTEIQASGKEVEPRKFAHFDDKNFVLYISNHDNQVYRLDVDRIELRDNGTDGVFFEFDPELEPFIFDPALEVTNYFQSANTTPDASAGNSETDGHNTQAFEIDTLGFSYEKFIDSYVDRYLVSRALFEKETQTGLILEEQQFLFAIYFYSLFFKSIQREKVILCFVGSRESGKSFIATSVGKIIFGDRFEPSRISNNQNDLEVVLGGNYYVVFDNVDSSLAERHHKHALHVLDRSPSKKTQALY